MRHMGWLRLVGSLSYRSILQNIVSFIGLFCKKTYNFKEPSNRSHPIHIPNIYTYDCLLHTHILVHIHTIYTYTYTYQTYTHKNVRCTHTYSYAHIKRTRTHTRKHTHTHSYTHTHTFLYPVPWNCL